MAMFIVYEKATGRISQAMSPNPRADLVEQRAILADALEGRQDKADLEMVEVDEALVQAIAGATADNGAIVWRRLQYAGGVVSLAPDEATALSKKTARQAVKKAAKQDAKLEALKDMTQAEWMNLSANDRWQTVFAFMKANMPDE